MTKLKRIAIFSLILPGLICLCNCFARAEEDVSKSSAAGKKIFVPKDYKTIKEAINNADFGDKIYIAGGEYNEPDGLRIKKGINIYGKGANKTKVKMKIIGVTLQGDNLVKDISFELKKGKVYLNCADNITLQNCVIAGEGSNAGLFIVKSEGINIINCTIVNFEKGVFVRYPPTEILIRNSIISHNKKYGIFVSPAREKKEDYFSVVKGVFIEPKKKIGGEIKIKLEYNDIWGQGWNFYDGKVLKEKRVCRKKNYIPGEHNISENPEFWGAEDFRLQISSPCIDAGDSGSKYMNSDGSRADMGALPYGE